MASKDTGKGKVETKDTAKAGATKLGPIGKATKYYSDSKEELSKVTWATKQESIQATLVTIVIILIVSVCLFLLDQLLGRVILQII